MGTITFLVKPASGLCDMQCRYCFYDDISDKRLVKNTGFMSLDTAQRLIQSGFSYVGPGGAVHFLFQGGEPTLAGMDFFRAFLDIVEKARPSGTQVSFAIQTNGLNLNQDWARLFLSAHFLVGLSLDGTKIFHDRFRQDTIEHGTWDRSVQALAMLDGTGVETNLLCVVTGPVAHSPNEVYCSLKRLGPHPLQFIPCLDPLEAVRGVMPWSLIPTAYSNFLKGLFDCWYKDLTDGWYVSVRLFDDLLRLMAGMPPSSCANAGVCGGYLVAEADGSLYPCDFYVLDRWLLGNIRDTTVAEALASPMARLFLMERSQRPDSCSWCPYVTLCQGGCKRDWVTTPTGVENYYCSSMKDFLSYALPRLQTAARILFC